MSCCCAQTPDVSISVSRAFTTSRVQQSALATPDVGTLTCSTVSILDFGQRNEPAPRCERVLCLVALASGTHGRRARRSASTGPAAIIPAPRSAAAIRAACAARCERDNRCRAWSFSYPRTAARDAMCWLKNAVTPAKEDSCCVSGVRGAALVEPKTGPAEFSIDRVGGDYRSFDVAADPTGERPAPRPARPTANAAPSPMCGPAMAAHRRAAI